MARTIDLLEAQQHLPSLIRQLGTGTEIIVTENTRPVARIVPAAASPQGARQPGLHRGSIQMSEDFDAPLPDDFWTSSD